MTKARRLAAAQGRPLRIMFADEARQLLQMPDRMGTRRSVALRSESPMFNATAREGRTKTREALIPQRMLV